MEKIFIATVLGLFMCTSFAQTDSTSKSNEAISHATDTTTPAGTNENIDSVNGTTTAVGSTTSNVKRTYKYHHKRTASSKGDKIDQDRDTGSSVTQ